MIPSAQRKWGDELACKPDSVASRHLTALPRPATIHLRPTVAGRLVRSTRGLGRAALERPRKPPWVTLLTLLLVGFTEPPPSPRTLVVSYTHHFTLTTHQAWRFVFCGTYPAGCPGLPLATTLP